MEHVLLPIKTAAKTAPIRRPVRKSANGGPMCHVAPVEHLLRNQRVQAKLKISQPNDALEQEADQVADHVMNSAAPQDLTQTDAYSESPQYCQLPEIQRQCSDCEDELQRKGSCEAMHSLESAVVPERDFTFSRSDSLPETERTFFERRMGADFSNVRVHTDSEALQLSQQINAHAFTLGHHIAFNRDAYQPHTPQGRRLLAHELTHVVQQSHAPAGLVNQKSAPHIARQCAAGTASLPWDQRVTRAQGMTAGNAKNQCFDELIRAALGTTYTVHESTNTAATIGAAITAGHYQQRGTGMDVNYDANLNTKTGNANQYGQAEFRTSGSGAANLKIYIVLGPRALNTVGEAHTRMANQHEQDHASDYTQQAASGTPRAATAGDELRIYARGLTGFLLSLVQVDTSNCSYSFSDDFSGVFNNYSGASTTQKNDAFTAIRDFYNNQINGNATNTTKFKVWFQSTMNSRPANDALVRRINALNGLSLTRGTSPLDHICTP